MKARFTVNVWEEDGWFVAQCLEVDVASQGRTEEEALTNLRQALELHFDKPTATEIPRLTSIEVEIGAAQAGEVRRRLQAAGFAQTSQRGSHIKFVKEQGSQTKTAIVPQHSEIAVGTLRSILRQAGLTPEEWDSFQ